MQFNQEILEIFFNLRDMLFSTVSCFLNVIFVVSVQPEDDSCTSVGSVLICRQLCEASSLLIDTFKFSHFFPCLMVSMNMQLLAFILH